MRVTIVAAPYDSGHCRARFGRGVDVILEAGLAEGLREAGHDVEVVDIGVVGDALGREIGTGFAVCRAVAEAVAEARGAGRFPVTIAGNCLTAAGAVAGEAADAIVWFDQHGDLNTPETSIYGFLDGMALATVVGLCWRPMSATIPGFRPVAEGRTVLVDARDLDPDETAYLARSPMRHVQVVDAARWARALVQDGARPHLHLDLDVHDPADLPANHYATPGGPTRAELHQTLTEIAAGVALAGVTVTAYDPEVDGGREVPAAVAAILGDMLAAMETRRC
jgi:arginase